ncbi:MAG TPA: DUF5317 domain-containing protein [Mycobacteriales bacterium]|nr:DUF5317 domain-containing protein [Mycobacteriales bacterium]
MLVAVLAVLAAVLVATLCGGSLERLGSLPLRSPWLVWAAFAAQLVGTILGGPIFAVGLVLSAALAVGWLVRNRGIRGTGLVSLGLLANAVVVSANGAMPVSVDAAGRAGVTTQALVADRDPRHELMTDSTRVRWLGDVIPVPLPVRPEVISPGDVAVAAGLAQLVLLGMLPAGARHRARRRSTPSVDVRLDSPPENQP